MSRIVDEWPAGINHALNCEKPFVSVRHTKKCYLQWKSTEISLVEQTFYLVLPMWRGKQRTTESIVLVEYVESFDWWSASYNPGNGRHSSVDTSFAERKDHLKIHWTRYIYRSKHSLNDESEQRRRRSVEFSRRESTWAVSWFSSSLAATNFCSSLSFANDDRLIVEFNRMHRNNVWTT